MKNEMTFNTAPNFLTLLRICFVPVIIGLLFLQRPDANWKAAGLFILASITDCLDGHLARIQESETIYGKLLDPLADKFLTISTLIMLQEARKVHPLVVILLVCREISITGLRAIASAEGIVLGASPAAKWKTALQMSAMPLLILQPSSDDSSSFGHLLGVSGSFLLHLSLLVSLWSATLYSMDFLKTLQKKKTS
jgi:CDP-diacylglycerol--glycerol-3-phosphate 3-phosphatidyltransferase